MADLRWIDSRVKNVIYPTICSRVEPAINLLPYTRCRSLFPNRSFEPNELVQRLVVFSQISCQSLIRAKKRACVSLSNKCLLSAVYLFHASTISTVKHSPWAVGSQGARLRYKSGNKPRQSTVLRAHKWFHLQLGRLSTVGKRVVKLCKWQLSKFSVSEKEKSAFQRAYRSRLCYCAVEVIDVLPSSFSSFHWRRWAEVIAKRGDNYWEPWTDPAWEHCSPAGKWRAVKWWFCKPPTLHTLLSGARFCKQHNWVQLKVVRCDWRIRQTAAEWFSPKLIVRFGEMMYLVDYIHPVWF